MLVESERMKINFATLTMTIEARPQWQFTKSN